MIKRLFSLLFILLLSLAGVNADIFFNDSFDRSNSNTVGNGWVETESSAGLVSIDNKRLKLNNDAGSPGEAAERTFDSSISIETFNWTFVSNLSQTTSSLEMQLRDGPLRCIDLRVGTDGDWHYVDSTPTDVDLGVPYILDVNQNHTVVVNQTSKTFDWIVDGSSILTGGTYRDGTCTEIDNIDYSGASSGPLGQFYFTNISVFNQTIITQVGDLEFNIIEVNNVTFTNNSLFNLTTLDFFTNVTIVGNSNINQSFSFDGGNFTQYATNNISGNFSINNLTNGIHTLQFRAFNTESNTTTGIFNFIIDLNAPTLIITLPNEFNFYDGFNFSQFISIVDNETSILSCTVIIPGEITTTCDNESYTFLTNGNKSISIIAIDNASNFNFSLNNTMLVNPFQQFNFVDGASNNVTNFTFGGGKF